MKLVLKTGYEIPIINAFEQIWRNMKDDVTSPDFDKLVNVTVKSSSKITVNELSEKLTNDAVSSFSIIEEDSLSNPSYEGYILRGITKSFESDGTSKIRIEFIKQEQ